MAEEVLPSLEPHRTEKMGATTLAIHEFDKAHLVMLIEEGLIPAEDGIAMLRGLRQMEAEGIEAARLRVQGGKHSGEQYLIRLLGEEVGGRIHLARSSGDLGETGRRITARDYLMETMVRLNELRSVLIELAPRYADAVMPGYSHGQNAQSTSYGHWLSMWAFVFGRDFERTKALYERMNRSPAGAAILNGTEFPINRARTAELLGFSTAIPHTMDAIMSHDVDCLEAAAVLAIHTANLTRLAEDIELWFSSEFGFIDLPDRFCGTSSIMMQKRNPYLSEEVKAVSASSAGALTTAFLVEKGSTGLAILERKATDLALGEMFRGTHRWLRHTCELLPEIRVNTDRMVQVAGTYWAQAADVAGALVTEKGLPWRTAHQIVGIFVRLSEDRGVEPLNTTSELLDEAAVEYYGKPVGLSDAALRDALDPRVGVARRSLLGGPAPEAMRRELVFAAGELAAGTGYVETEKKRLAAAHDALEHAVDALIG
ncbi:MAG: argininosuccinate lyase [Trebonia sp.]